MQEFILPKNTILANNEFIRFEQYEWNDVMAVMAQNESTITIGEHNVRINRLKYQTFVRDFYDGKFCCSSCGLEPSHAVVFGTPQSPEKFINFFAIRDNKEVLLTHDHTLARALGGSNELSNTTTMCEQCNGQKSVFESIYGNHRLDIIKNYLNNSLGQSVSLSKLDQLAKNFDISELNPKFLSGSMYLLFVFNNEAIFDKAVELLSQRLGMNSREYLTYCNNMGEQHMKPYVPTIFPFARIFYPKLSSAGAQFLRLDISRHLKITWPNGLEVVPSTPVYFDEILQSVVVEEQKGIGKVMRAHDLQDMLKKHPKLFDAPTLYFGTTPVDFSQEARACLKNSLDPELVVAVRKNIRRSLVPGFLTNNTFSPVGWESLNPAPVTIAPHLLKHEPRLSCFNGLTSTAIKEHPMYLELLIELVCFKEKKSVEHLIKHSKSKTDSRLLELLHAQHPQLPVKAREALASTSWTVNDFFAQWERKSHAEKKSQHKLNKKHQNSKLKRHFAREEDQFFRSKSKRALY